MLTGKVSIITGSNRGIGKSIVEVFARNSSNGKIYACARTQTETFESEMNQLASKYNVEIEPLYFDLTDSSSIKAAVKKIRKEKQTIDVLVNNAGINSPYRRFQMIPMDDFRKMFEANVFGHLELTQMISRIMMQKKDGSIINVSSIAGTDGFFASCDYVASKAAIMGITVQQARELGGFGIRVNHIAPGVTETDMVMKEDQEKLEILPPAIMLGRFGRSVEIANAILFLASDLSSYITGQELRVDGGSSAPKSTW